MADPLKLQFKPGVNRETTDYGNTGGWYDCNLTRWISRTPTSMGGWAPFTGEQAQGTFRSLFPWSVLNGTHYYGTGTSWKYYIVRGNGLVDITPIRKTTSPMANNSFATSVGTKIVTVTDVANGAVVDDFVTFSGATGPFGGVPAADINQEHQIISIVDADHYTILVATTASSSTSGGGNAVVAAYQINVGLDTSATGNGWGTGPWGSYGWGEGSPIFVNTDQLRLWTEDNFGEDLLINPRDGGVYYKDMSGSITDRAVDITSLAGASNPPTIARQVLVSDNDRHILVFATNTIGTIIQDPLLIRWSDTESLLQWTPDTTNTAGSLTINAGSQFLKAVETTTETLVFTDITLHSLRFVGPPYTFGQTRIGTNVQLIGPNAVVSTGSVTFWMATGPLFQMYDGVVHDMPCDVRTYIASILNTAQVAKIIAGINRQFHEVMWMMPVNGSDENNFYVACNYEDPSNLLWYYGDYNATGRTTWIDSWFETTPLAGSPDGYIYAHDTGATDQSVDPPAMLDSYLKSSVFEIGNGDDFIYVSRMIPDVEFTGSTATAPQVTITFRKRDYPGSAFVDGPDEPVTRTVSIPVEQYTTKVDRRFRARSVEFGIETTETGTLWSLGVPRIYGAPDGKR
jgi:hypothetical protein